MTEFPGIGGGQIAGEDLVADATRVGGWSPECVRAAWLAEPGRPWPGARFTGRNRFPDGFEYEVTCVVTEADRPVRSRGWSWITAVTPPARPRRGGTGSTRAGGGSRARQRFTHGPGASFLRAAAVQAPDRAAEIIAARRDGLQASTSSTLRAMKAAAESSHAHQRPGQRASGPG